MIDTGPAMSLSHLTRSEVVRLPLYVQEELYRLNMRLEESLKTSRRLRGETPEPEAIATVALDLNDRQVLPLDSAVRWQFGQKWDNAIDVRRGLVERRTIRVYGIAGTLAVLPDGGCNVVTIRLEDR
jgi:hypothetical protein